MSDKDDKFIAFLEGLVRDNNRAALANLRRGLGKKAWTATEMFPYIAPFLRSSYPSEENAYFLVASLVGLNPDAKKTDGNLGFSIFQAQAEDKSKGIEKRFVALLNSDEEDLPSHLRLIISLLKSKEKPINWLLLLKDIKNWNNEKTNVRRNWARSFWGNTNVKITEKGEDK